MSTHSRQACCSSTLSLSWELQIRRSFPSSATCAHPRLEKRLLTCSSSLLRLHREHIRPYSRLRIVSQRKYFCTSILLSSFAFRQCRFHGRAGPTEFVSRALSVYTSPETNRRTSEIHHDLNPPSPLGMRQFAHELEDARAEALPYRVACRKCAQWTHARARAGRCHHETDIHRNADVVRARRSPG